MRALLIFAILFASLRADDPQLKGPGLSIDLISENRSVTPGQAFTVGLHIHHFEGFHTYWKNPGIVGVETSIEWSLPEGFQASEISWPYPEKSFMAEYPCHGYERDVTLLVTITPPKKIDATSVKLSAKTAWMCCAKGCFPGFKTFELTLPVKNEAIEDPTAKAHIQKARAELPKASEKIKATLLSAPDAEIIKVLFSGIEKCPPSELYFFSSERQISSDKKQEFSFQKDGSLLLSVPRSEFSPEGETTLPGVLKIAEQHYAITSTPKLSR